MSEIYAIIRDANSKTLRTITEYFYSSQYSASDIQLANFYNYATDLEGPYTSCLPRVALGTYEFNAYRGFRQEAYAFSQKREEINNKYDVVAISHRFGGFTHIDWNFGEDISFHIYTNFGYGSQALFHTTFKYKGLILAPYSFYVKFRNSTYADVVSCTNCYNLEYKEWYYVMQDCLQFYNAVVNGDSDYVRDWVNRHIENMLGGLETYITSSGYSFTNSYSYNNHVSSGVYISGDDFWIIKSKKIANSLKFVDSIQELTSKLNLKNPIERLHSLCVRFKPLLKNKVQEVEDKHNRLTNELKELESDKVYTFYTLLRDRYYYEKEWYRSQNHFKMIWFLMHLKKYIFPTLKTKDLRISISDLEKRIEKVNQKQSELYKCESFKEELKTDLSILEKAITEYEAK